MVEGEWLNGQPHGICIVETDETRGILVFTHGNPFGAPGWVELKNHGIITSAEIATKTGGCGI